MKICLIEPVLRDAATKARIQRIYSSLNRLGYSIVEQISDSSLLSNLRKDEPDVVFNLASIYAWDKTNLVPALLEIEGVDYTGSGILGLSLARNYTRLYPLFENSGIRVPAFWLAAAGSSVPDGLRFPLMLLRDSLPGGIRIRNAEDLDQVLRHLPAGEEVLLLEQMEGDRESLFLLDHSPFLSSGEQPYLSDAQKACDVIEARGLVRFDFIRADEPVLEQMVIAPDPLDEQLLRSAARLGWGEDFVLQSLVQHAGRDHSVRN